MVDEFENDLPNNDSVGERVRASVAELCGALDDLIDDNDATSPSQNQNQNQNPSLREQLIHSWQGKSYYERLEGMVNAGAGGADFKGQKKLTGMSTKTKPLSSINLNSVNNGANNQQQAKKSSYVVLDWHCSSPPTQLTHVARTHPHAQDEISIINLPAAAPVQEPELHDPAEGSPTRQDGRRHKDDDDDDGDDQKRARRADQARRAHPEGRNLGTEV